MSGSMGVDRGGEAAACRPPGSSESSRMGDAPVPGDRETDRGTAWIVLPVAAAAALLVLVLATRGPVSGRGSSSPVLGGLAPALVGVTMTGEPFDLDEWRGRWVIVNFFSTGCAGCVVEHPELVDFHERRAAADDARIVSVVFDDSVGRVREFFMAHGGDWPVLAEGAGAAAVAYGVTGVPESYLVAPSGVVVWKQVGGVTADGMDDVIARLEAGL